MILPNKVIRLEDSIIGKTTYLLDALKHREIGVEELYYTLSNKFDDINDFIVAIDVLFVLGSVVLENEVLKYVNRN
jgi:hypothetical protein